MARQIYLNLPVKDLARMEVFTALFRTFTDKDPCDTSLATGVLVCLSCDGRAHVDQPVRKARAPGGAVTCAARRLGFMHGHGFEDPDGHIRELICLAPVD